MKDFGLGSKEGQATSSPSGADCEVVATFKERPILFSGPMIPRLLDESKTQTRRVIKPQPGQHESDEGYGVMHRCPYEVGMRLWVKETFTTFPTRTADEQIDLEIKLGKFERGEVSDIVEAAMSLPDSTGPLKAIYRANYGDWANDPDCDLGPWTPSIYMPRAYSRITREVTEIRVQRVQEISASDAKAEGCPTHVVEHTFRKCYRDETERNQQRVESFQRLWDSINAKPKPVKGSDGQISHYVSYPWNDIRETRTHRGKPWHIIGNPSVWCLSFKAVQP